MSTHQATDANSPETQPAFVSAVVLVALVVAIYVAFWVLQGGWNITARIGFCIIIPGLIGAGLNALANAASRD